MEMPGSNREGKDFSADSRSSRCDLANIGTALSLGFLSCGMGIIEP